MAVVVGLDGYRGGLVLVAIEICVCEPLCLCVCVGVGGAELRVSVLLVPKIKESYLYTCVNRCGGGRH